jgi:hypothetical protein
MKGRKFEQSMKKKRNLGLISFVPAFSCVFFVPLPVMAWEVIVYYAMACYPPATAAQGPNAGKREGLDMEVFG